MNRKAAQQLRDRRYQNAYGLLDLADDYKQWRASNQSDLFPPLPEDRTSGGLLEWASNPTEAQYAMAEGFFNPAMPAMGLLGTIGGPLAYNAPMSMIEKARKLKAAGKSDGLIAKETGVFLGAKDGKARWEFSDADAAYNYDKVVEARKSWIKENLGGESFDPINDAWSVKLRDLYDHPTLYEAYPDLQRMNVNFVPNNGQTWSGFYSPSEKSISIRGDAGQWLEGDKYTGKGILAHEIQHAVQQIEDFAKGGMPEPSFTNSIKRMEADDVLGKEYLMNELENQLAPEFDKMQGLLGEAKQRQIYDTANTLLEYSRHPDITRIQKHVRNNNGWLYGHQDDEVARELLRRSFPKKHRPKGERANALSDYAFDVGQYYKGLLDPELAAKFEKDTRLPKSIEKAYSRELNKQREILNPYHEAKQAHKEQKAFYEKIKHENPFDIYQRLLGEDEARVVQKRLQMTQEQLNNEPWWMHWNDSGMDFAPQDQISYTQMKY